MGYLFMLWDRIKYRDIYLKGKRIYIYVDNVGICEYIYLCWIVG